MEVPVHSLWMHLESSSYFVFNISVSFNFGSTHAQECNEKNLLDVSSVSSDLYEQIL
jgi:hypothetical protein